MIALFVNHAWWLNKYKKEKNLEKENKYLCESRKKSVFLGKQTRLNLDKRWTYRSVANYFCGSRWLGVPGCLRRSKPKRKKQKKDREENLKTDLTSLPLLLLTHSSRTGDPFFTCKCPPDVTWFILGGAEMIATKETRGKSRNETLN